MSTLPKPITLSGVALSFLFSLAACGGAGTAGGESPAGGASTDGGGSSTSSYVVKSDLCAEADLGPLAVALPVITKLKPSKDTRNGATAWACHGNAGVTDSFDDIGFISLVARYYGSPADASREYDGNTRSSGAQDQQPITGLGEKATSFTDGPQVRVMVLAGPLVFMSTWSANGVDVPATVRPALIETTKATLAKLKAG
jgi:hypothetical protein